MKHNYLSKELFVIVLMSLLLKVSFSQESFSFSNTGIESDKIDLKMDETVISVGDGTSPYGSYNFPIDFYAKTSLSQSIYTQDEINHEPFSITKLQYTYKTVNPDITVNPIEGEEFRVWLCNTSISSISEESGWWIPYSNFTLVYDGSLVLETGQNKKMTFELDSPYVYNGDNLCIMVERKLSENEYPNHFNFTASTLEDGDKRARVYWSYDTPMDFENMIDDASFHGMTLGTIADVEIFLSDQTSNNLEGVVTSGDTSEAIAGAKVEILNTDLITYTDNEGYYSFPVLNPGNQTIKVSAFGYESQEITLDIDGETTQNFVLSVLSNATVNGKVVDKDNNPIEGANIYISGYENYNSTTDETGSFSISDVLFAEDYTIVTSKDKYINDTTTFDVTESIVELNDIVLADFIRSPSLVKATVNENTGNCNVTWLSPNDITDYRYDGGTCWNGIGHVNGEVAVFGNVFRESAQLYKASWYRYSTDEFAEGNTIKFFVFPLNDDQLPMNEPIIIKEVYSAFNAWTEYIFEEPLEIDNGFMLAISGAPSDLGMGIDEGLDSNYPFLHNVNYVSENYLDGDGNFITVEDAVQELPGNFMIRAEGYNLDTGDKLKNITDKSVNKYKVYRLVDGNQDTPSNWELLDDNVTDLSYTDNEWDDIDANWYRYAVKAVYSDNVESEAAFSNLIDKSLTTNITIEVTTNTPNNGSLGTEIILRNEYNDEYIYTGIIENEDGTIFFEDVMKGMYSIDIELEGYVLISEEVDFTTDDNYTISYQLVEDISKPDHLEVVVEDEVYFYWNLTQLISDGFENYEDFEINPTGDVKWTYLDLDGNATTTFGGINFPNQGEPSAFIVFTPEATQPPIDLYEFPGMAPHSGNSYLMSLGYPNSTNNDFIISPKLNFSEDFTFEFYAKSFSITNFPKFKVGYSTTSNNAEDFIWLTDNPVYPVGGAQYTEYTYNVPKEAKYVCINNISEGEVILMIDYIKIKKGTKSQRNFINYKVYLDGVLQGETIEPNFIFDKESLESSVTYEAGVEAVYSTGTSERATIEFITNISTEDLDDNQVVVYPNPANHIVNIKGDVDIYYLYDVTGKIVLTGKLQEQQIDISHIDNGIYTLQLKNDNQIITKQIVVKH